MGSKSSKHQSHHEGVSLANEMRELTSKHRGQSADSRFLADLLGDGNLEDISEYENLRESSIKVWHDFFQNLYSVVKQTVHLTDIKQDEQHLKEICEAAIKKILQQAEYDWELHTENPDDAPPTSPFHRAWRTQYNTQTVEPLSYNRPKSLKDIQEVINGGVQSGIPVRAKGAGHSYSDAAVTPGILLDTYGLYRDASEEGLAFGLFNQETKELQLKNEYLQQWYQNSDNYFKQISDGSTDKLTAIFDDDICNVFYETETGVTIGDLNEKLKKFNLALPNMGGYDGQTLAGAISTSTHGSGFNLPPLPDMVRSMVLCTTTSGELTVENGNPVVKPTTDNSSVFIYRIEPTNGLTDPTKWKTKLQQQPDIEVKLIQDDSLFYSCLTTVGSFGVIYSYVIAVKPFYWLSQKRELYEWENLKKELRSSDAKLNEGRHVSIVCSPYPHGKALITWNKLILKDTVVVVKETVGKIVRLVHMFFELLKKPFRHTFQKLWDKITAEIHEKSKHDVLAKVFLHVITKHKDNFLRDTESGALPPQSFTEHIAIVLPRFVMLLANFRPTVIPEMMNLSMEFLELFDNEKESTWYEILKLGLPHTSGFAAEVAYPLVDTEQGKNYSPEKFIGAMERIRELNAVRLNQYKVVATSPFGCRFIAESKALISMFHGSRKCTIEFDMVEGTYGGWETMRALENGTIDAFQGRPHWGLEFGVLVDCDLEELYDEESLKKWLAYFNIFNPHHTFENNFTSRAGFTRLAKKYKK